MSKHTFTTGARVRVFPSGKIGTVVDAPEISQQFPGFVPVHFDSSDFPRPCSPDHLVVIETGFAPGDRVKYSPSGVDGTVVEAGWESGADVALVHIDGAPMATVCYLAELVRLDLDHVSDADLGAEVAKRLSEGHEDALREEMQREVEAAEHRWQAARMTEWLAKPTGPKVKRGSETHRIICAIQVIREQVPACSINKLADKAEIPRSTLKGRLNGSGALTAIELFVLARAMGVHILEVHRMTEKGTAK